MIKAITKYLGSGVATAAAVLVGGRLALADPPRVEPRTPEAVRETPREAGRDAAQDARVDRRAHRAPGELGLRLGAVVARGLAISNLVESSVFYTAGIRPGDYIVSVNGHQIVAAGDFDRYLYANGADQPVQIVVWRNGADQTITLQPNVLYADNSADNYDNDLSYFGVEFDPQYQDRLVILRCIPGSQAYLAGLRNGDEITTWHGERIRSPRQFAQVIHDEKPGSIDFGYNRGSKAMQGNVAFDRRAESRTALKPVTPNNGEPARDPIPTVTPPAGREPIPTVKPPVNPREPIPTVTPPASREPSPSVTPPAGREPAPVTPPAGREPPRAAPPEPANSPRPAAEAPHPGAAPAAPAAPREK
jgi:predicted metalloprotease with PDZ domain